MKKWMSAAVALCLLLTACGGKTTAHTPQREERPPAEELVPVPEAALPAGWQTAYAAFLEELAEQVRSLRNVDRPDYDPNTVDLELAEVSGSYVLYDIDKDGIPELLIRYGAGEAGYHTTVYGYKDGAAAEIGDIPTGHTSLYTWPGENGVACNWSHMGGHFVDRVRIVDGMLEQVKFFGEDHFNDPERPYTSMTDIVPGSVYLRETRTLTELPEPGALTLPIYDYGREWAAELEQDEAARRAIEGVLEDGGAFYGVTADGFGGDTGWTTLEAYLQPGGVTEFAEEPLEAAGPCVWEDFNGDGRREALLNLRNTEGDLFSNKMCVIFSQQEGVVYAYCLNYMDSYRLEGAVFRSDLMGDAFRVSFDREQCYTCGVE